MDEKISLGELRTTTRPMMPTRATATTSVAILETSVAIAGATVGVLIAWVTLRRNDRVA